MTIEDDGTWTLDTSLDADVGETPIIEDMRLIFEEVNG